MLWPKDQILVSVGLFFRWTKNLTDPSSFRTIRVSRNGILRWDSSLYANFILPVASIVFRYCVILSVVPSLIRGAMAINLDKGVNTLDHVYDSLLKSTLNPGKETTIIGRFPGKSSEPKHLWSSQQARWRKLKSVSKIFGFFTQSLHLFYYNPTTNEAINCI